MPENPTPIERGAEALHAHRNANLGPGQIRFAWDDWPEDLKDYWLDEARAAFESIDRRELAYVILKTRTSTGERLATISAGFDIADAVFAWLRGNGDESGDLR